MLQLLHFVTFQNATSMQVGGLGLVGDIKIGSLDRRTGDIHYHQPWLRPALPKGDWDVIESSIKSYVRDFNSLVQKLTNHIRMSCTCPQSPLHFQVTPWGHEPRLVGTSTGLASAEPLGMEMQLKRTP